MSISAKVIADSVCPAGIRIATLHLRYPRFIHSEFMTHRVFSRNARSSRAVPTRVLLDEICVDAACPLAWGRNRKGMQATEVLEEDEESRARHAWERARDAAVDEANRLLDLGVHKQIVNRILEPFAHIDVLVTSTDWANFFTLRLHPDAQPEMRRLAEAMGVALGGSEPRPLAAGQWHTPYVGDDDTRDIGLHLLVRSRGLVVRDHEMSEAIARVSAARCRRISYKPFDGGDSGVEADLARFDEMVSARPIHASPMEHQAMATGDPGVRSGNFRGYVQFRQMIRGHDAEDPR